MLKELWPNINKTGIKYFKYKNILIYIFLLVLWYGIAPYVVRVTNVAGVCLFSVFLFSPTRSEPVKLNFQFRFCHCYFTHILPYSIEWNGTAQIYLCACACVFVAENGMCFVCVLFVQLCLSDSEMQIKCKQLPFTLAFTSSYGTSTNIALAENDVV